MFDNYHIVAGNSIMLQDSTHQIDMAIKRFEQKLSDFEQIHTDDMDTIKQEIDALGKPVRQALEKNQREAENMVYELKHCQKQSRELFTEFDKAKRRLLDVIESLKNDGVGPSMHNTVSVINMDTKILVSNPNNLETVMTTTVRNMPISPLTQVRTVTANMNFSKGNMSKLPILRSKGYMTAREMSQNMKSNDSDFKSFDGTTIKETEADDIKSILYCIYPI
jgi:hypothetical protein